MKRLAAGSFFKFEYARTFLEKGLNFMTHDFFDSFHGDGSKAAKRLHKYFISKELDPEESDSCKTRLIIQSQEQIDSLRRLLSLL